MSPWDNKGNIDNLAGDVADIVHSDLIQIEERISDDIRARMKHRKEEGLIPDKAYVKIALGVTVLVCNPDEPGPKGTEERFGRPRLITII